MSVSVLQLKSHQPYLLNKIELTFLMGSEERRNVAEQFTMADIFVYKNQQIDLQLSEV